MKKPVRTNDDLFAAYRQMSEERAREIEAENWAEGLIEDAADAPVDRRSRCDR
jgi:hypothetical protein